MVNFSRDQAKYLVLPVLVYLLFQIVVWLWANEPLEAAVQAAEGMTKPEVWEEASKRLAYLSATAFLVLSTLGFAVKSVADYRRLLAPESKRIVLLILAFGVLLGLITVVPGAAGIIPRYRDLFGPSLFVDATDSVSGRDPYWGMSTFNLANQLANGASVLCGVLASIQIVGCLSEFRSGSEVENWRLQAGRLKLHTYISALLLVIAVLAVRAWALYPSFMLSGEPLRHYEGLVSAFITFLGVMYSLILASAALPVAYALVVRARGLSTGATRSLPSIDIQIAPERATVDSLDMSPTEIMKTILAVLAPFLAGGIAGLPAFGG